MEWIDTQRFMINGRKFVCCELHQFFDKFPADEHVIWKTPDMIEAFLKNIGKQTFRNVLEIGIARGGSAIWLNELLNPAKFVAIDFNARPVEALERYRRESGRTQQLSAYYGVDQQDEQMLRQICADEFDNQSLDLIIDDASHLLGETSTSFNFLFPRLAAGGLYVIEDWAWSSRLPRLNKELARAPFPPGLVAFLDKEPLAPLICHIILAAGDAGNMIDGVYVDALSTYVRRGNGPCGARFDVAEFNRFHDGSCMSLAPLPPAVRPAPDPG